MRCPRVLTGRRRLLAELRTAERVAAEALAAAAISAEEQIKVACDREWILLLEARVGDLQAVHRNVLSLVHDKELDDARARALVCDALHAAAIPRTV